MDFVCLNFVIDISATSLTIHIVIFVAKKTFFVFKITENQAVFFT